jgi:hypothetical protein
MLPLLAEVGVVLLDHLEVLVAGELGDGRHGDAPLQGVGDPRVPERVADDALELGQLRPQPAEAAAEAVPENGRWPRRLWPRKIGPSGQRSTSRLHSSIIVGVR